MMNNGIAPHSTADNFQMYALRNWPNAKKQLRRSRTPYALRSSVFVIASNNKRTNDCARLQTKAKMRRARRRTNGKDTESEMECKVNSEIIKLKQNAKRKRKHHKFIFGVARLLSSSSQPLSASSRHRVSFRCLLCCPRNRIVTRLSAECSTRDHLVVSMDSFRRCVRSGLAINQLTLSFSTNSRHSNAKCKMQNSFGRFESENARN